jgi:hypothetical protein
MLRLSGVAHRAPALGAIRAVRACVALHRARHA